MLPAKDRQPTTRAKRTSTPFWAGTPVGRSCRYSDSEMTAAAAPPTPLKMATIWGIPVMGTLRAAGTATRAPEAHAGSDHPVVARGLDEEGQRDGHHHAGHSDQVPVPGVAGRAEGLQGQDETDRREQVYGGEAVGADVDSGRHGWGRSLVPPAGPGPLLCWRPLNMSSMRSVTTTPPTMLSVARNTATNARACLHGALGLRGDHHGAHQDDPVNGVAAGHERRMQDARHLRYHLETQESGEDEDEQ